MHDGSQRSTEQKTRLLDSSQVPSTENLDDPMAQYNYVAKCYNNTEYNGKLKLETISESGFYRSVWRSIRSFLLTLLIMLTIALPGIGILIYLWLFIGVMIYFSGLSVYRKNSRKVLDPFKDMVLCPELCIETQTIQKEYEMIIPGNFFYFDE